MLIIIEILKKIITNPKLEAIVLIYISNLIGNKINNMSTEEKDKKQPLYLPRGSVRATLALLLTLLFGASYFFPERVHLPAELEAMWLFVIGYYIGYRSDNSDTKEIKY